MPDVDGVQLCAAIGREGLATRVLIVSGYDDDELVYAALEAGASGYVPKDAPRDEVARAVLAGGARRDGDHAPPGGRAGVADPAPAQRRPGRC